MTKSLELAGRLCLLAASAIGAIGVAAAAAASHDGGSRNLAAVSAICLAHAPAIIGLALAMGWLPALRWPAALLIAGTILFVADLATREWLSHGLFPGAAPLGGRGMILGWLALGVVAIAHKASN